MKGLLIKDYYLMFQRKLTIVIFIALCIFMGISMDGAFIIGYMTVLGAIFAIGTISYDEADNGMPFLMTLPAEKKTYALSKYIFGIIVCVAAMVVSVVLMLVINAVRGTPVDIRDSLITIVAILPVAIVILDIMIPLQLKFGAEKSRILLIVIVMVAMTAVTTMGFSVNESAGSAMTALDSIPDAVVILGVVVLCAAVTVISVSISSKIVEKKTY